MKKEKNPFRKSKHSILFLLYLLFFFSSVILIFRFTSPFIFQRGKCCSTRLFLWNLEGNSKFVSCKGSFLIWSSRFYNSTSFWNIPRQKAFFEVKISDMEEKILAVLKDVWVHWDWIQLSGLLSLFLNFHFLFPILPTFARSFSILGRIVERKNPLRWVCNISRNEYFSSSAS